MGELRSNWFRYLVLAVVLALPLIVCWSYAYAFETPTVTEFSSSPVQYLIGVGVYSEILWLIPAALFIAPLIIGKMPDKKEDK